MQVLSFKDARMLSSQAIRKRIRLEHYNNHTSGLAANKLQANIVILPNEYANDFFNFCKLNPKACPLVGQTKLNHPYFESLGEDIDIRYDVPLYNIYKNEVYFSELSPRPHDTGMVTMFTQNFSEFDLHARAILDFTIPKIELCKKGVSQVILANKNAKGKFLIKGIENAFQDKNIDIRIFGKPETKPYRRMGVILASNLKKAKEALSKIKVVNV